jgi:NNP family nitrate/nitrite transporter-like MFS transporter
LPFVSEDTSKVALKESSQGPNEVQEERITLPLLAQIGPVVFLALIFFLNFISRIIFSPLLPTIERELGISHGQAGFFFFLIAAGYLGGLLGSGFLSSRTSHRGAIIISGAGLGAALIVLSLTNSLWPMRAGLFGLGLAAGLYIPSAIATITALVDQRHWGKALAVHELAPNLAFFIAPFIAELFLHRSGWRAALGTLGIASVIMILAYSRFGKGGRFSGESPASSAVGSLLRAPAFWIMLVLFGLGVSSTIGVYAMLPLYLVTERHLEASWANTLTALSRSYAPISAVLGGWVSDWLGPKRTIMVSLTFTGLLTLLLGLVADPWIGAVIIVQPCLAVWFFPAGFAALAVIAPPRARNLAVGFTIPLGYVIGGGAIPTLIGVVGDAGSFAIGFMTAGILIICAGVLAVLLNLPVVAKGAL